MAAEKLTPHEMYLKAGTPGHEHLFTQLEPVKIDGVSKPAYFGGYGPTSEECSILIGDLPNRYYKQFKLAEIKKVKK